MESAEGLVSFYRGGKRVGNRASKTDHQPEVSDIHLIPPHSSPHLVTSGPDPTGPRGAAPVPTIYTGVSCDSQC